MKLAYDAEHPWRFMQWRCSVDGKLWASWKPILSETRVYPAQDRLFYQVRVYEDGEWITSGLLSKFELNVEQGGCELRKH